MTKYEIMVIAAAAAAFVIINIIMWSIIAAKEKRARRRNMQQKSTAPYQEAPRFPAAAPENSVPEPSAKQPAQQSAPAAVSRQNQPVQQKPRVKRSDFVILDDIVIVHTDERIIDLSTNRRSTE